MYLTIRYSQTDDVVIITAYDIKGKLVTIKVWTGSIDEIIGKLIDIQNQLANPPE